MKILYFSLKGGVGKSSLALNHALGKWLCVCHK